MEINSSLLHYNKRTHKIFSQKTRAKWKSQFHQSSQFNFDFNFDFDFNSSAIEILNSSFVSILNPPSPSFPSMCKTKKSIDVIDPKKNPKPSSFKSSSSSTFANPSSSSSSSSSYLSSFTSSFFASKSSPLGRGSLSSLRESLPENPHIYELSEIVAATNRFLAKPFSSSSSSSSWRCSIRGRDAIVFQRKSRRQIQLPELKRLLSVICRSHHSALVKLLGASLSGYYVYLVYEFVEGANLADCLRNRRNPNFTVLSTWLSRIQIAADLAHGLDYVHHCSGLNSSFIHNHIKSSSIIVDDSLSPKICHFGASELCGEVRTADEDRDLDKDQGASTSKQLNRPNSDKMKVEGTRGYMAPEVQSRGQVTQKSDVYAFGVVLLELVSGEAALKYVIDDDSGGYRRVSVIETAIEVIGNGGLRRWVDRRLRDSYPVEVAEKMIQVALECVGEDPNTRPDMGRVAGLISKLFLESKHWAERFALPTDFSVSMAPR